jgi:phosphomannomutase/phosphoglucomutase
MAKLFTKKNNGPGGGAGKAGRTAATSGHDAQGIAGRGDALRAILFQGMAIVLLPLLLLLAFLLLFRAPGQEAELLAAVGERSAALKAETVRQAVDTLRRRAAGAARSPLVMQAVAEQDSGDVAAIEQALLAHFPEALSLRVLPLGDLGTADLEGGFQGLRNHIEVDLVRRAAGDEIAQPEAYQFEGRWLASLAQMAVHPQLPERRAAVLITLPAQQLTRWLDSADAGAEQAPQRLDGKYSLQQRYIGEDGRRDQLVVSVGSSAADAVAAADVADTPWAVLYHPSPDLVASLAASVRPDYDMIAVLLLFALGALLFFWRRSNAAIDGEVQRIAAAAEQRTPLAVRIPQLVPMAKELRKLSLRRARVGSHPAPPHTPAAPAGGATVSGIAGPSRQGLPAHIFRAYDIRGVADSELDDETVYRIGSAIGTIAGEMGEQTIIIGCDGRASSGRIRSVLEKALLQAGRDVIDIGLVPTPLLYFATRHLDAGSGIMVTGSHNPAQYNGLKIVLQRRTVAQGTIDKIRSLADSGRFTRGTGHLIQQDVLGDYLDDVIGDIAIAVPLKVVVDAGNGATGPVAPTLLTELGCEVIPMYCDIDGSFPNRGPDTGDESNLADLVREVITHDADFGVAFDGDGDRIAVVTGSGRILRTDTLLMLFARDVVSRNPGADVVYDVKCSRNLAQLVTSLGGRPVLWKTGHALMKEKMLETGALLGGEFSGHIFFGERWYGFDDGMYAAGRLAEILSSQEGSLDELLADLPRAVSTPEILVPVTEEEKFPLVARFVAEAKFPGGKANDLDGLRVDFHEGWGLLRASNTSAALTARFEAQDEGELKRIQTLFREQLQAIAPDLRIPF